MDFQKPGRILIVTDAWVPQTNGVVTTLQHTAAWLERFGHAVRVLGPSGRWSLPWPGEAEIRLSLRPMAELRRSFLAFQPDALHIATEGPLGLAARRHAVASGLRFTTSYHTHFPIYLQRRIGMPRRLTFAALRRFHAAADRCLVSTPSLEAELRRHGFARLARWGRGVDTSLFRPQPRSWTGLPRPLAVYLGRVAPEKDVERFLRMRWRGAKMVIGDGPDLPRLRLRYPDAFYTGRLQGEALARHLAAADVMVFPSRTDTFGLVQLEALACGVPVAAHPVAGPADVIEDGVTGALDEDLSCAAQRALAIDPRACRDRAMASGWETCTRQFESQLVPCFPHAVRAASSRLVVSP